MEPTITFGRWLRQRRKALDLTQQALAQQVGCALATIKKIEQDERRPSRQLAELLAERLAIPPAEQLCFLECARGLGAGEAPVLPGSPAERLPPAGHHLRTQPTTLIGRDQEIATICERLLSHTGRLLTLVGPPGIGKTRLALAAAEQLRSAFRDGVYVVSLASIADPKHVPVMVASAVGLAETEYGHQSLSSRLVTFLRDKALLLVLDNLEHLLVLPTASAGKAMAPLAVWLADLLAETDALRVLATSRAALRLRAEQRFVVPPLAAAAAVALFTARAQAIDPDFAPTAESASLIEEICRRLDGLPLAIELIAARSDLFSPQGMLARLQDHGLDLLDDGAPDLPPSQQTLRKALQRSYDLLNHKERRLLQGLGVFVGGATLEAIEIVCDLGLTAFRKDSADRAASGSPSSTSVNSLASLVHKSLVCADPHAAGAPRYTLLETIRDFALEQLHAAGAYDTDHERHAAYFLHLAEEAARCIAGDEQRQWLDKLAREHDNLRAALRWCIRHHSEHALRLAAALGPFWGRRGYHDEGRRWLAQALTSTDAPLPARAQALLMAGSLAQEQSDWTSAAQLVEASLSLFHTLQDRKGIAKALGAAGWIAYDMHLPQRAIQRFTEGLSLWRQLGDRSQLAEMLTALALTMVEQTEEVSYEQAAAYLQESLAILRPLAQLDGLAHALTARGILEIRFGNYAVAAALYSEALALFRSLAVKRGVACTLAVLGDVTRQRGETTAARPYYEQAQQLFQEMGATQGESETLYSLGQLEYQEGNLRAATEHYSQSLRLCLEGQDKLLIARCLAGFAGTAWAGSAFAAVARLAGAVESHRQGLLLFLPQGDRAEYAQMLAGVRTALGEQTFTELHQQGTTLTTAQAVDFALTLAKV